MKKSFNWFIIVLCFSVLSMIGLVLEDYNREWAALYFLIITSGSIVIYMAINFILLFRKGDEIELFQEKISMNELGEFLKKNQPMISREDLLSIVNPKSLHPFNSGEFITLLESMGYSVERLDDNFVSFNDGRNKYCGISECLHMLQTNYMRIYQYFIIEDDEVELYEKIASYITTYKRIVKVMVEKHDEKFILSISAETFFSGTESVSNIVRLLLYYINVGFESVAELKEKITEPVQNNNNLDLAALQNINSRYNS